MKKKELPGQEKTAKKPDKKPITQIHRFILYVFILLVVFLLGFLPIWIKYRAENKELVLARQQLAFSRIENHISAAVINAQQTDYEAARQAVSQFFTALQEINSSLETSDLPQEQQDAILMLFTNRDELITLLARNDEAAVNQLFGLYAAYSRILNSM